MKSLVLPAVLAVACACSAQTFSLKSPDNANEIRLMTEPVLSYSVLRGGTVRVAPTPISLTIEGKGVLGGAGLKPVDSSTSPRTGSVATPLYKKAAADLSGTEARIAFEGGWGVTLAARNDGVAYRFFTEFPEEEVTVKAESADIVFPNADLDAWAGLTGGLCSSWESIYKKLTVGALEAENKYVYLPLLVAFPDGVQLCVTESDLLDYPGWNLRAKDATTLVSASAALPDPATIVDDGRHRQVKGRLDFLARTAGRRTYPWRVFMLAPSPAKLCEADIPYALATPCRLSGDLSWIRPGKVQWDWWCNWNVSGVDFKAGCNTATYRHFIDFAAENGLEYVIMDEGWSVKLKIMEINPETDVPAIVKYGRSKGVGIVLWCGWPQLVGRQHEVFAHYAKMGVKGFKIDFMDRDDQFVVKYLEETARIAAEYKLVVDYHGMYKPTGLSRTYPNILNYEGVHGLECAKFHKDYDMPGSDVKVMFTRMSAGPMDYTPGAMRYRGRPTKMWTDEFDPKKEFVPNHVQPDVQGTRVHQMALMTACEAPFQMLCDSPTQYRANRECFDFMAAVPVTWDEVKGVGGTPDTYFAIARRKGAAWYVAVINDWQARDVALDLSFLGENRLGEIFADGLNADRDPADYTRRVKKIDVKKPLNVTLAPGGGWTAKFTVPGWTDVLK